jgi:HEAT repeat protein
VVVLGGIRDARAVDGLVSVLTHDEQPAVRAQAAIALGAIGDARAVEPLLSTLRGREYLTVATRASLVQIGPPAVAPLLAGLKDGHSEVHQTASWALARIGSPAVDALIALLGDRKDDVRARAAETLGAIGDVRAVGPLVALVSDRGSSQVRARAAHALGAICWKAQPWLNVASDRG